MYILNDKRPKTDPCGMPIMRYFHQTHTYLAWLIIDHAADNQVL